MQKCKLDLANLSSWLSVDDADAFLPPWRGCFHYHWCSRSTIILRSSRRRREDLSSAESSITRNGSRELIGAMYRLHPVSTLRCSRLTRQVQVPIVKLWIRETCSISPPQCAHSRGEQLQNYDISRVTLTRVCEMDSRPDRKILQIYNWKERQRERKKKKKILCVCIRARSLKMYFSIFLYLTVKLWFWQIWRRWTMRRIRARVWCNSWERENESVYFYITIYVERKSLWFFDREIRVIHLKISVSITIIQIFT